MDFWTGNKTFSTIKMFSSQSAILRIMNYCASNDLNKTFIHVERLKAIFGIAKLAKKEREK